MALNHPPLGRQHPIVPRVAIYCRVSTQSQEENSSLRTQAEKCQAYAAAQGWAITEMYQDVHTGSELFERTELSRLREQARGGNVDIVLAYALDRISRNQAHLGFLVSEFDHQNIQLVFVTEELADTPEGRLLQSVRSFVAEVERLKIAERTKRGVRARVDSGRPIPGCKPPYGYRWKDSERSGYATEPVEAVVVKRIFDDVLTGSTLRGLAMQLTAEGIPTPTGRGRRWEISSIRSILKHPIYFGQPVAYRTKNDRVRGRTVVRTLPEAEWIPLPPDIVPPLISKDVFDAVAAKLAHNKATAPRNNANPEATLLRCGIGRCGYCGHPLQVTRRNHRGHMYRCHPVGRDRHDCPAFGVMAHILDAAVWQRIEEVLLNPSLIRMEVDRRSTDVSAEQDVESIDRRLRTIATRQGRLARAIAALDDDEASAPLLVELKSLAADAQALTNERTRLAVQANASAKQQEALLDLEGWCRRVAHNLHALTYAERRLVLETLGVTVRVFSASHNPRWEIDILPMPA